VRLLSGLGIVCFVAGCQRTEPAPAARLADCAGVADWLAAFELGNYATPEARVPVVAKHKAACEAAKVTADEATCLTKAKDTWTARACLPRMFPAPAATGSSDCATVGTRMRAAVMSEVGNQGSAAAAQLDILVPVIQTSCDQDRWPKNVVQCIVGGKPGDMNAFQTCSNQLPKDIQDKVSQRLAAAMQMPTPPTQQQPTPPSAPPAK
jgi:hypothetical protein